MCTNPKFTMATGTMPLKCGKCLECLSEHSKLWIGRCMDEASLYDENCFLTLTYAETDGDLHRKHFQDFVKRLRSRISPVKIRYYGCGEYGSKGSRPHFHVIIFGWMPPDIEYFFTDKKGCKLYKSEFVSDVWKHGFITVGDVNRQTIKYCTKYLTKLDDRPHSIPPFSFMSNRPGIGAGAIKDSFAITGTMYRDGKQYQIPKYYLDKLQQKGYNVDMIKQRRRDIAIHIADEYVDVNKLAYQKYIGDLKVNHLKGK